MPTHLKKKQLLSLPLLFACCSLPLLTAAANGPTASLTPNSPSPDKSGAKSLHLPRKQADVAPSVVWKDETQPPRLVLLCIHGLGLHKGTYEAFGKQMCKYGIAVHAIDMRGFGDWLHAEQHTKVDFDGSLADVRAALQDLHHKYPGLPIVVLGESMGGAIALRTAALYPDLVSGLISCVPSGDRFNELGQDLKVGLHVLLGGGFNRPLNIGRTIVKQATKKDELRKTWEGDPSGKMQLSASELIKFSRFMGDNFEAAQKIKNTPVLFIQGVSDKLVRPAGTWRLYDELATPNRQFVLSKNAEHLIFEDAQFSQEDLLFVRTWISRNIAQLDASAIASDKQQPAVASSLSTPESAEAKTELAKGNGETPPANNSTACPEGSRQDSTSQTTTADQGHGASNATDKNNSAQTVVAVHTPSAVGVGNAMEEFTSGINYWIELYRGGRIYRCNNKAQFKSGDAIRFHIIPQTNGYAYVIMKESSSGKSALLFPTAETGTSNYFSQGQDYPLPYETWLQFDQHPGIERLSLIFSKGKINPEPGTVQRFVTAYVSPEMSGAKDLVPTRMQLSWDDPTPVILPEDFSASSVVAQKQRESNTSLVRLTSNGAEGVLAVDIALAHN